MKRLLLQTSRRKSAESNDDIGRLLVNDPIYDRLPVAGRESINDL
jgi:hypothetical protein